VLTFQGTADPLVPAGQAKALHEALKKAGVTERLVLLEGAGHGWGGKEKERTDRLTLEFLDRHLKGGR
jgi:dipeptidyl aminopeptidase/acylaminoacyl peptidase